MEGDKERKREHYEKKHRHDQKDKEKRKDNDKDKLDLKGCFDTFGFEKMMDFIENDYDRILKRENIKESELLCSVVERIKELRNLHYNHHKELLMDFCK